MKGNKSTGGIIVFLFFKWFRIPTRHFEINWTLALEFIRNLCLKNSIGCPIGSNSVFFIALGVNTLLWLHYTIRMMTFNFWKIDWKKMNHICSTSAVCWRYGLLLSSGKTGEVTCNLTCPTFDLTTPCFGNIGCGVSISCIQNHVDFCLKLDRFKENFCIFWNGVDKNWA